MSENKKLWWVLNEVECEISYLNEQLLGWLEFSLYVRVFHIETNSFSILDYDVTLACIVGMESHKARQSHLF